MITTRTGDLLEQMDLHAIVHQCNCFCTMGAGIAKSISIKWPEAKEADKKTIAGDEKKLGTFSKAVVNGGKLWIYNMYSQYQYGAMRNHTNYFAMEKALNAINLDLNTTRYYFDGKIVIGIPYGMGCGLAGGNWVKVMEILKGIYDAGNETDRDYKLVICRKEWGT